MSGRRRPGDWIARISIGLKPDVLDPQGKTVRGALAQLGFASVRDVRVGKHLWIRLAGSLPRARAEREVRRMAEKVLANPVIETWSARLERSGGGS